MRCVSVDSVDTSALIKCRSHSRSIIARLFLLRRIDTQKSASAQRGASGGEEACTRLTRSAWPHLACLGLSRHVSACLGLFRPVSDCYGMSRPVSGYFGLSRPVSTNLALMCPGVRDVGAILLLLVRKNS